MRRKIALMLAVLGALVLLAGCKVSGNPLPEGMEEETVLERGREVVAMLNAGEWQEVYDLLRTEAQRHRRGVRHGGNLLQAREEERHVPGGLQR